MVPARILGIILFLTLVINVSTRATEDIWTVLAVDPKADGRDPLLADVAQLSYRYDKQDDMLWFRLALYGEPNKNAFGVNIAINSGAEDTTKAQWWGANKDFTFDRLVTVWVVLHGGAYEGTVGVADAAGVQIRQFDNLVQNKVKFRTDSESIVVGMKRTELTGGMKLRLIGAVGSNQRWNDDITDRGSISLDVSAQRPVRGLREIDVTRNNFHLPPDHKVLSNGQPPTVKKAGRGDTPIILIPGVYSGTRIFDDFMSRNEGRYRFYLVTPPGLDGTPARPLPAESISIGEFTWTRQLQRDTLDLVRREKLKKPVILVHGFPGSLVAESIAVEHPGILGGIIEVASMPVQPLPSFKDPTRKAAATPQERIETVDEAWLRKWFKYVTPETWVSNNYPPEMYTPNSDRGERVRQEVESAPLPVKIRYLAEFMASDHTSTLLNLPVPLLALKPGFDEEVLAEPSNSWFRSMFHEPWDKLSQNSRIQVVTIPRGRALLLDEQPETADKAIAAFVGSSRGHLANRQ